jgi:hypothetical protein
MEELESAGRGDGNAIGTWTFNRMGIWNRGDIEVGKIGVKSLKLEKFERNV